MNQRKEDYYSLRNLDWEIWRNYDGTVANDQVKAVLLMDIREELKKLNRLLSCPGFIAIPRKLDAIKRALPKKSKK